MRYGISHSFKFLPPPPLDMVVVEITTYCNLKCAGCIRTVDINKGRWQNQHMGVDEFKRIVDALPKAKLFIPQGVGEPTFHPELKELIRIAKEANKFGIIEINTNALVRGVDYYSELFDAGLSYLTISVDTFDPTIIELVRKKTNLDKLKQRLTALYERFPGKVGVRVTVGTRNVSHLGALLTELNEIGPMKVWLQPFFDMGENAGGVMSLAARKELINSLPGLTAHLANLTVDANGFVPSADICLSPWSSPGITVEGEVKPCCLILHQEPISFGNSIAVPFSEIWNSFDVEHFRGDFRRESPSCCINCPFYSVRG